MLRRKSATGDGTVDSGRSFAEQGKAEERRLLAAGADVLALCQRRTATDRGLEMYGLVCTDIVASRKAKDSH